MSIKPTRPQQGMTAPPVYRPSAFARPSAPPVYSPQQTGNRQPIATPVQAKAPIAVAVQQYFVQAPMSRPGGYQEITVSRAGVAGRVGSVRLYPHAHGQTYLSDLVVSPDHRRHGLAKMLVQAAQRTASARGHSGILLEASPSAGSIDPESLISMYQKMGFRRTGSSPGGKPLLEFGPATLQRKSSAIWHPVPGSTQPRAIQRMIGNPFQMPDLFAGFRAGLAPVAGPPPIVPVPAMAAPIPPAVPVAVAPVPAVAIPVPAVAVPAAAPAVPAPEKDKPAEPGYLISPRGKQITVHEADIRRGTVQRVRGRKDDLELIMRIGGDIIGIHLHPPRFGTKPTSGGVSLNGSVGQVPAQASGGLLDAIYNAHKEVFDKSW